jgi:hypothetical protein
MDPAQEELASLYILLYHSVPLKRNLEVEPVRKPEHLEVQEFWGEK